VHPYLLVPRRADHRQALVNFGSTAPYDGSITGGTGKYEGAKGELHVQNVSPTEGILTFHLEH